MEKIDRDVKKIFDNAIIVVNGFAFTRCDLGYQIFNGRTKHTVVVSNDGEVLATTMDDIELEIAKKYFEKDKEFLEDDEE